MGDYTNRLDVMINNIRIDRLYQGERDGHTCGYVYWGDVIKEYAKEVSTK